MSDKKKVELDYRDYVTVVVCTACTKVWQLWGEYHDPFSCCPGCGSLWRDKKPWWALAAARKGYRKRKFLWFTLAPVFVGWELAPVDRKVVDKLRAEKQKKESE